MAERIWTGKGDDGTTGLFTGERVKKDSARVEAYGTLDELIATLGLAKVHNEDPISSELHEIQQILYRVATELASKDSKTAKEKMDLEFVTSKNVEYLEERSDILWSEMPPLSNFVIPGDSRAEAFLHHARTVCRRAERRIIALGEIAPINAEIVRYVNRLSDFIFTLARYANFKKGSPDTKISQRDDRE